MSGGWRTVTTSSARRSAMRRRDCRLARSLRTVIPGKVVCWWNQNTHLCLSSPYRFDDESSSPTLRSPKFAPSPPNNYYKGWWTYPYFSCAVSKWLVSYSIAIPPSGRHGLRGFISVDIDVTSLRVNQCDATPYRFSSQQQLLRQRQPTRRSTAAANNNDVDTINDLQAFHSSHKCHRASMVVSLTFPIHIDLFYK